MWLQTFPRHGFHLKKPNNLPPKNPARAPKNIYYEYSKYSQGNERKIFISLEWVNLWVFNCVLTQEKQI